MRRSIRTWLLLAASTIAFGAMATSTTAQAGEVLWKFDLSNISGAFVTVGSDGTIYTADRDRLWAINPTGTVKWTFDNAGGAGGLSVAGGGQPVEFLPDGRLVVAAGHTIWALETDGTVSWSFTWSGGFNNQIDNGPSVGPDGNIYATTATNSGLGLGAFSLTPNGQLRWQDDADPPLLIINASHGQRVRFTDTRLVFGFMATSGAPSVYAYDFDGKQTNLVNYTCTSSPKTNGVDRLLLAGVCGVQSIDLDANSIEWSVSLGPVNMLPIAGDDGVVYSGSWHGPVTAISAQGQVLWTSPNVRLQRTLAVNDQRSRFLYAGEIFGQPNWFGAIDTTTGASLWQVPFETVGQHNELSWSNEAAFSPDGTVAYFTTRFTSNGAPGRLWAVRIANAETCQSDLGFQGPGTAFASLCGTGLNAGESSDYEVIGAPGSAAGAVFVSLDGFGHAAVLGGTLVSFGGFAAQFPAVANGSGQFSLTLNGIASPPTDLVLQSVFLDGSTPAGVAFTNAVLAQFGR